MFRLPFLLISISLESDDVPIPILLLVWSTNSLLPSVPTWRFPERVEDWPTSKDCETSTVPELDERTRSPVLVSTVPSPPDPILTSLIYASVNDFDEDPRYALLFWSGSNPVSTVEIPVR